MVYVQATGARFHLVELGRSWDEIAELARDSYRLVAPKRLVAQLEGRHA